MNYEEFWLELKESPEWYEYQLENIDSENEFYRDEIFEEWCKERWDIRE